MTAPTTYRVVQWATGNIGSGALRATVAHPRLKLVGLYVHSANKVGKDAGELAGLGKQIGVKATNKIEDILALKPDCVLYMPQGTNFDEICRLLEAGINIVTTRGDFHYPGTLDPAVRTRVEQACRKGNASIHSTGSSPGFVTEALPMVLTLLERRLDCLTIDEYADLTSRDSPDLLFNIMGFGHPPATFDERRLIHIRHSFVPSLSLMADAFGIKLDGMDVKGEVATVRKPTRISAGELKAGTIGAQRITVSAMHGGKAVLRFRANWYCTRDVEPPGGETWDLRETGWRVMVEGDTPLKVDIYFPVAPEKWAQTSPGLTAHPAVNAVSYVVDAPPGIRTSADLPKIIPLFA